MAFRRRKIDIVVSGDGQDTPLAPPPPVDAPAVPTVIGGPTGPPPAPVETIEQAFPVPIEPDDDLAFAPPPPAAHFNDDPELIQWAAPGRHARAPMGAAATGPPPAPPPAPPPVATGNGAAAVDVAAPPVAATANGGTTRVRLGELLVDQGIVTREQVDYALAEQVNSGLRLGAQLVQMGFVSERVLIETLAAQLQLPVADLRLTVPEPAAVELLPEEVARRFEIAPLRLFNGSIEVAMADVLDDQLRAELEAATGKQIVAVLAPSSEIRNAIERMYVVIGDVVQQVEAFQALASSRPQQQEVTQLEVDDNAPVVQVVNLLLNQAVRDRASDIHIEPQGTRVRVRYRVDGVLREVTEVPEAMAQSLVSRIKVMADMNIVERRRPQDGQFTSNVDGRPLDVRVSTASTVFGEKAVLRLLDKTKSLKTLLELGMTPDVSTEMYKLVNSPFGMVVCAGPTGSGKTTTLYAALKAIDDPMRNITTIEDPVEYVVPTINQMQVNNQAGITFADGLRSILRQDPDVILVGEVRDQETAGIAIQSALTGHLVLSSVHATDAATAVQRFRDMGIEPFLVTSAVLAVVSQRLVRRICPHCRTRYEATPAERAFFLQTTGKEKELFWAGAGCNLCSGTGYSERVGVYELLRVSEAIRQLIMADAGYEAIRSQAVAEGMHTLKDEVMRLVDEDFTTIAEAARTVSAQ